MTGQINPIEDRIDILLTNHNGDCCLSQQLDLIVTQAFKYWRIVASDDGSTDGTSAIYLHRKIF